MGRGEEIKMETRIFSRSEWDAFAGSTCWADQSEPLFGKGLLGNGKEFVLVIDPTSCCLLIEDDPVNDFGGYILEVSFPTQAAAQAFARGIGEPKTLTDFLALGFREA